jgi:hypothetical protein
VPIHDTRFLTVRVPKHLTDEEILSRFVKGFFGGYVFKPERNVLRAVRKEITGFESKRNILLTLPQQLRSSFWHVKALEDTPVSSHIWSVAQLSNHELQPLHTLLFGAFRVVDSHLEPRAAQQTSQQSQSYIDFAFGSDKGYIAGVHRFSVSRDGQSTEKNEQDEGATNVTIEFAHAGCNPRENKPLKPDVIQTLHMFYSILLFMEGVAEVHKAQ